MFDDYYINQNSKINIVENRAPTDASISILQEMQEKVLRNIISRMVVDDNTFKGSAALFNDNLEWCYYICVKYNFNSIERIVKIRIDQQDINKGLPHLVKIMKNGIAEDIAVLITENSIFDILSHLQRNARIE